jgi:hypothetical protein
MANNWQGGDNRVIPYQDNTGKQGMFEEPVGCKPTISEKTSLH